MSTQNQTDEFGRDISFKTKTKPLLYDPLERFKGMSWADIFYQIEGRRRTRRTCERTGKTTSRNEKNNRRKTTTMSTRYL